MQATTDHGAGGQGGQSSGDLTTAMDGGEQEIERAQAEQKVDGDGEAQGARGGERKRGAAPGAQERPRQEAAEEQAAARADESGEVRSHLLPRGAPRVAQEDADASRDGSSAGINQHIVQLKLKEMF